MTPKISFIKIGKMSWKNWPSWLKGGVIGGIFSIMYYFFFFITQMLMLDSGLGIIFYPLLPLVHFIMFITMFDKNFIGTCVFIILFLFLIFLYGFIIGSLITFFIAKINSRSKKQ